MNYLPRDIDSYLSTWKEEKDRQPLLIRGARQVGKSSIVQQFGKKFEYFLEVNFEQNTEIRKIFDQNLNPLKICEELSLIYNIPIEPGKTLLFFDEIQSCLPAISSLRYFYEQYQTLHIIAAGSLLEFALSEIPSYGVGRVHSVFVYPFSFNEFLKAHGEDRLIKAIEMASPDNPLSELVHNKALEIYKRFVILGGLPKVISNYVENRNLLQCQQILDDLVISYQDDFAKYKKRISTSMLREVFNSVVLQNGQKFVYSKTTLDYNRLQIKTCLDLLTMAGLIYPVTHSAANGIPLGAKINIKFRKYIIFDTGVFQRILGLNLSDILLNNDFQSINKGAIAELHVGLEIMKTNSQRLELFYWHRESKNSNAEVDYIVQKNAEIFPIEVKSGTKGSMQSLFLFLDEKNIDFGIRVSQEKFARYDRIKVYPVYAVANIIKNEPTHTTA